MPLIQVKVIENVFTDEQKQEIVRRLTDAMVEIEGENMRPRQVVSRRRGAQWRLGHRGQPVVHGGCQGPGSRGKRLRSRSQAIPQSPRTAALVT